MSKNLVKRRGGHKAQATKVIDNIKIKLLAVTPADRDMLKLLRNELMRQKDLILALDSEILNVIDDDDEIQEDINNASEFIINLDATLLTVENFVKTHINEGPKNTVQPVKLPNLVLPRFNGDPLKWSNFWDMFKTTIHMRLDLSAPAKFQYLVSQLEGEAANLVSGFDQTENEYVEAIELLKLTYGRPQLLIQNRLGWK